MNLLVEYAFCVCVLLSSVSTSVSQNLTVHTYTRSRPVSNSDRRGSYGTRRTDRRGDRRTDDGWPLSQTATLPPEEQFTPMPGLAESEPPSPATLFSPQPTRAPQIQDRLDLSHNQGPMQSFLQRINDRLTTLESLDNQQLRKLESIEYRLTKIEIISQDKSGSVDKSESHLIRKLEDLEYEIGKFGTLLDVVRQDIDKLHQRQTELKVAIASNTIQNLVSSRGHSTVNSNRDEISTDFVGNDLSSRLQSITSNVNQIRKANENMQNAIYNLGQNLTVINNMTRTLVNGSRQFLTKQYFHASIKDMMSERNLPDIINMANCDHPLDGGESTRLPSDCSEILESGVNKSGIYRLSPRHSKEPFFAYCDMDTDGGGWTVIQKRFDGSINFYREWLEYKHGFGNLAAEHWLGNEKIYLLTNQDVYHLRIDLEDFDAGTKHASYSSFALGAAADGYMLKLLGNYEGDAGDSFSYHASMKFSTKDIDNDPWDGGNCAEMHTGGWWYKGCETANLNGQYLAGDIPETMHYQGVYWYEWHGPEYSLLKTSMKIRPLAFHLRIREETRQRAQ